MMARAGRRTAAVAMAVAVAAAVGGLAAAAGPAAALPQQQGSLSLLGGADGEWQGPAVADGSSAAGTSVAGLPALFGGRRSALAIGAPDAAPGGRIRAGTVYVVPGMPGTGRVDLTALGGRRGYRIDGQEGGDRLGAAVTPLTLAGGDPGLAIGAPGAAPNGRTGAGKVYVLDLRRVHGDVDLSRPRLDRAVVAVVLGATPCAETGTALADAGRGSRARGDGLVVGAPGFDPAGCPLDTPGGLAGGGRGAAYVLDTRRLRPRVDLRAPGAAATSYTGAAPGDRAGSAVGPAGGGGRFTVGAPAASPAGRDGAGTVYLLRAGAPGATVSLAQPPAGATVITGAATGDSLGQALATTVDFAAGRARGAVSLALGAPGASPRAREHAGAVFLVPVARDPARVDLAGAAASRRIGRIDGAHAGDGAGSALAGVGDLGGTGRGDLAIGAPFENSVTSVDRLDNGAAYVLYGGRGGLALDLARLGGRGFVAFGARNSDEAGTALAGVADENGDGRPDLLIGAPFALETVGPAAAVGGAVDAVWGFGPAPRRGRP